MGFNSALKGLRAHHSASNLKCDVNSLKTKDKRTYTSKKKSRSPTLHLYNKAVSKRAFSELQYDEVKKMAVTVI
jgi:hypothetical protein